MEKALVLGASGGMGYSIVNELSSRGIPVIAFARNKEKLVSLFQERRNVTILSGDIFQIEDLLEASADVGVIFYAANIPYSQWGDRLSLMVSNVVEVARRQSAKLAVVDNIYAYGKNPGELVTEKTVKNPHTKKGKIRLSMEDMIKKSTVPTVIAHFPDFYGPNAQSSLLHYTLKNAIKKKNSIYIGDQKIAREFIYTPDGAKAMVELALTEKAYGQNWNIPGYGVITGEEIIAIIREVILYDKKVSTVTKRMIQFLGIFNKMMREVVEMYYLNEDPVVLSGEKYEKEIGTIPKTSYREGIWRTIQFMKKEHSQPF